MKQNRNPYEEGFKLGFEQKPVANPHDINTQDGQDWARGWKDGNKKSSPKRQV